MRSGKDKEIRLQPMARRMMTSPAGRAGVPKWHAMTNQQYEEALVEYLRGQRLALTDAEFRKQFSEFI